MKRFFEKIFSRSTGWVQIWTSGGGAISARIGDAGWVDDLHTAASAFERRGADIYFRVTTISAPPARGRGGEDITLCVPAVWVDIDIATGAHAAADLPSSVDEALAVAVDVAGEPSIVVATGGGVHVYWIFAAPLTIRSDADRASARAIVDGVQAAIRRAFSSRGWRLDATSDLARVLRVPGTQNYKYSPPRDVAVVLITDAVYDIDHFSTIATARLTADSTAPVVRPAVTTRRVGDARIVLEKCNFIKHCRDDAAVLPEPEWYAMITNIAPLDNGAQVVHGLSSPYPRYTPEETDEKIAHALAVDKPHTCAFIQTQLGFHGCPPGGCGVKAPIELGRRGVARGDDTVGVDRSVPPAVAEARRRWRLPSWRDGRYAVADDGSLVRVRIDEETGEERVEARIARLAIAVVEAMHDVAGDGPVMYKLQFIKPGLAEIVEAVVDAGVVSALSESDVREIAKKGAVITTNDARRLRQYFSDAIAGGIDTTRYASRGGWHEGSLHPYDGVQVLRGTPVEAYVPTGDSEEVQVITSAIRRYPVIATAAAASVAAVLIDGIGLRSFTAHFFGPSGAGKTAAIRTAAAIWGAPDSVLRGWDTTRAALEIFLSSTRHLPIFIDERQIAGGKDDFIQTVAYMIASGTGRSRATKDLAIRSRGSWETVLISTGEEPLFESSSWTGARRRVLDVDIGDTRIDEETARAIYAIKTGGAIAQMIAKKLKDIDIRQLYDEEYEKNAGMVEAHRAVQIAAIAAGARILSDVIGVSITDVVRDTLMSSARRTAAADEDEATRGLKTIVDAINSNFKKFSDDTPAERWGWVDDRGDEVIVEMIEGVLSKILRDAGLSPARTKRDLAAADVIDTTKEGEKIRYRVYSPGRGFVVRMRLRATDIASSLRGGVYV